MSANKLFSYRNIILLCTFLTGTTGLVFQVIWQKYLSYLVGSESRSMSLVVAVFLLGLASGYEFWGKLSAKVTSRYKLLKIYGYIEMGIGAYAIIFPSYYHVLEKIAHRSPNLLIFDFFVTLLAIFIPTFLMGGTIPLLTSVIPEKASEVNSSHAQIYGINTLGAVLGALGGGFLFLPWFGLSLSLVIGGCINIFVGLILGSNSLEGTSQEKDTIESIPNHFGNKAIYALVFVTGCISISLELLFIRLMNLTIGSGFYVFPLVVGVFVLGLALGSLSLYRKPINLKRLFNEMIFLMGYFVVMYVTVPYWPYWMKVVRISLTNIPTNYPVFLTAVTLFLAIVSLPFLIPLGRLLPVGYSLIAKNHKNYGKICGHIYFMNAIGTLIGSLFIGHYLLHWLNIDQIFKFIFIMFALMSCYLLYKEKDKKKLTFAIVVALIVLIVPYWDRSNHVIGLFRDHTPKPDSIQGVFHTPNKKVGDYVKFFADGPNTTVAVLDYPPMGDDIKTGTHALALMVNGKSDGSTYGDHATITLVASIPYMYAVPQKDLNVAVVGLGTGVTAGILGAIEDVKKVTVLEIASTVIDAAPLFDKNTFNLSKNPKVQLVETDAFRFFTKTNDKFDVIVSEPSNPWVVGVENLYTPQFYQKVKQAMNENGVLMQWTHNYGMNGIAMGSIIKNIASEFKYVHFYAINAGDIGMLASMSPIQAPHADKRWNEPIIKNVHTTAGLYDKNQFDLLRLYEEQELRWIGKTMGSETHDIDNPTLAYVASKSTFLQQTIELVDLVDDKLIRHIRQKNGSRVLASVTTLMNKYKTVDAFPGCKPPIEHRRNFICTVFTDFSTKWNDWIKLDKSRLNIDTLNTYRSLRERGLLNADLSFLKNQEQMYMRTPGDKRVGLAIVYELMKERQIADATKMIEFLETKKVITADERKSLESENVLTNEFITRSLAEYNAI